MLHKRRCLSENTKMSHQFGVSHRSKAGPVFQLFSFSFSAVHVNVMSFWQPFSFIYQFQCWLKNRYKAWAISIYGCIKTSSFPDQLKKITSTLVSIQENHLNIIAGSTSTTWITPTHSSMKRPQALSGWEDAVHFALIKTWDYLTW